MATNVNEIRSSEWSLSVNGIGQVVEGFDDINQCIRLAVMTQKGTDPLRPEFGCDIWRHLDGGIDIAAPLMVQELLETISTWERRIEVTEIGYDYSDVSDEDKSKKIDFRILWVLAGTQQRGSSLISLDLSPRSEAEAPPVVITPLEVPVLSGTYIGLQPVLTWTYANPTNITFQVLRAVGGGVFEELATVLGETMFTDTATEFDTVYRYRVRAVRGSRVSEFSNEVQIQTLQPVLTLTAANPSFITVQKTGTPAVIESEAGVTKVYVLDGDTENITAFFADDESNPDNNAGITGALDLSQFAGLRTVRARNQSFAFVPGTWVRNANVVINLSNSLVTAQRLKDVVNSIITANGGTTTDNGTEYTGVAGETHANRQLIIGYIELDLTAPENIITFQKVVALQSVGWTITTIKTLCLKSFEVNTVDTFFAVIRLEKTRRLLGLDYISGQPLDIDLYETVANAGTGGSTGRLAQSYAGVNTWLLNDTNYNAWAEGDDNSKALRFFAADTLSTGNRSNLRYQAFPTPTRACGAVTNVLGLQAVSAYSTRKILQAGYAGPLFHNQSDLQADGDLKVWFNQSPTPNANLVQAGANRIGIVSDGLRLRAREEPYQTANFNETRTDLTLVFRAKIQGFFEAMPIAGVQEALATNRLTFQLANAAQFRFSFNLPSTAVQFVVPTTFMNVGEFNVIMLVKQINNYKMYVNGQSDSAHEFMLSPTFAAVFDNFNFKQNRIGRGGGTNTTDSVRLTEFLTYFDALNFAQISAVIELLNT
jgi:phage baseplate assembly protein W